MAEEREIWKYRKLFEISCVFDCPAFAPPTTNLLQRNMLLFIYNNF